MNTIYIIDGYAQFFRAYHAIRAPMSSPVTKEPTNMTFGFVGMLLKLLRAEGRRQREGDGKPTHLVVALDVSGDHGTFRSQLYPAYKANRTPPPGDLLPQIDRCLAILREIGVPTIGAEGFEADDAIATLVSRLRAERPDLRIRLVSKDKDLKQLIERGGPGRAPVEMYDVHTDELVDADRLRAETGLEPGQIVDLLSLMGDNVDNVPGVAGVGEKTAALLLQQFGSLDSLMARAGEVKGRRGENIRAAAPALPLSRQLVTLRRDAPVPFELADAHVGRLRLDRLAPLLRELGFNRYQDELRALLAPEAARAPSAAAGATNGRADGGDRAALFAAPDPSAGPALTAETARQPLTGTPFRPSVTGAPGLFDSLQQAADRSAPEAAAAAGDYRCIRTRAELHSYIEDVRAAGFVSIDTETTSLSPLRADLCGISLSIGAGTGVYIPVRSPERESHLDEREAVDALRPVLEDPLIAKCGHNLKYDLLVLRRAGVELRGLTPPEPHAEHAWPGCDSMVASYLIDSSRSSHSLDALALALLKRTNIPLSDLIGSGKNQRPFDSVPLDRATRYAAEDADVALQLRDLMMPQLRALGLIDLWSGVELPLVEVLAELEWNGVLVDPAELDRQGARLTGRIAELRGQIDDAAYTALGRTFNPESPKQLAAALFNRADAAEPGLGLKAVKRTQTGYSTDIEVLEKLAQDATIASPIPRLVVEHRQLSKLVGTYLVSLKDEINPRNGRIHASFNQTVAATGRLSASDPNLQNIPIRTDIGREIRRAFIAPPGNVLISADYSQIELRLLAHLSRDPALIEAFRQDQDIHTAVAAQIHGVPPERVTREQRGGAKMVNFGIVYGITSYGLARRLGITESAAAEIIAGYKKRFSGITTFLQECIEQARRWGYVETMLKRRRPIDGIDDRNPSRRALAERVAINSVVQGSAADLIKIAMIDLHTRLSEHAAHRRGGAPPQVPGVRMILQVHDELVFEAEESAAGAARELIVARMENAMQLSVPLKVDSAAATDWFEGK